MSNDRKTNKKSADNEAQACEFELVLPEVLEMTDPNVKVRYVPMTEEEKHEWARQWAALALDCYEKEHGKLPPPPSKEVFNRMWEKIISEEQEGT